MARIRSVHPGLFTDERFVSVSPLARLMIIGLWTEADDKGVFEWKPLQIKMRLFPADTVDTTAIEAMLSELATADMLKSYELDGRKFGLVRNFGKYQRPKKPNDVHPLPPEFHPYAAYKPKGSEEVPDQTGSGTENPEQMEDGGDNGRGENSYSKNSSDECRKTKSPSQKKKEDEPLQELLKVLDAERAKAVIAHRKAKKAPLTTAHAARLLAEKFSKCPSGAAAAADEMISRGWQGFEPGWMENGAAKPAIPDRHPVMQFVDKKPQ